QRGRRQATRRPRRCSRPHEEPRESSGSRLGKMWAFSTPYERNLPLKAQGSLRNHTRIHSTKDMIWNNRAGGGVFAAGYQRDANEVEIRDNETKLQFLGTRFVKLTASGAFDGLQNRRMMNRRRTDLRIVGGVLTTPDL